MSNNEGKLKRIQAIVAVTGNGVDVVLVHRFGDADGSPEGVRPTLDRFCERLREEELRGDDSHGAKWLVSLGLEEEGRDPSMWKYGSYFPSTSNRHKHAVEYIHVVNAANGSWHPIRLADNEAMRDAADALDALSFDVHNEQRQAALEQLHRRCMDATKQVFEQLQEGALHSWSAQPAAPTP